MKEEKPIEETLEECTKKRDEYFSGWQREKADFINYKNKEMERLTEILSASKESMVSDLLPILDNFGLAEKSIPEDQKDKNIMGLLLIKKQLEDYFKSMGVEEIDAMNKKFDPRLHEAVEEVENKNIEPGVVISEVEKGYTLNSKLLRPSKVKISK
jgi:molecular chaperone GrpE